MKHIIVLIFNLFNLMGMFIMDFFMVIWYGTLPKASVYHRMVKYTIMPSEVFNDINCQVRLVEDVPVYLKDQIITDYIQMLFKDPAFKSNIASLDIPLFDGKEIFGSGNALGILNDVRTKHLYK